MTRKKGSNDMNKMRRIILSITFVAVLALSFTASATTAYAGGGNNSQGQTGQSSSPKSGGTFQSLGITWE